MCVELIWLFYNAPETHMHVLQQLTKDSPCTWLLKKKAREVPDKILETETDTQEL